MILNFIYLKKWGHILTQSRSLEQWFYKKNVQIGFITKILNNCIKYHKIENLYHQNLKKLQIDFKNKFNNWLNIHLKPINSLIL